MATRENLREALLELSLLREQEAAALRESRALLHCLAEMTKAPTPTAALRALLTSVKEAFACEAAAFLVEDGDGVRIDLATDEALTGVIAAAEELLDAKPRRIVDLRAKPWWNERLPAGLLHFRALLTAATTDERDRKLALACFSSKEAAFTPADARLLDSLSGLATQALASRALSERHALLAAVIEGSSASVTIADATLDELPLIYVNEAFEQLTGYSKNEVLGTNCRFLSVEPPDSPERTRLRAAVAGQRAGSFEVLNKRKDGSTFWNRLNLYPVLGEGQQVRYLVATQLDASERRSIERERDQARDRLASALSSTSEGFLLIDSAGRIAFTNERYRDFFGCQEVQWQVGSAFSDVFSARLRALGASPNIARATAERRQARLFSGCTDSEELLPDGRIVLLNDRPTADGGAVSIATDVSALKRTERLLAERVVAIDAAQDGIAIANKDGAYVYMNPSHLALFGYRDEAEVLGRHWTSLYRKEQSDYLQRVALPELERVGTWRGEVPGLGRDGTEVQQEVSLTRLHDRGLVCVTRDVSERWRNERERARLNEQLYTAQRHEAIGQLAAGFAHDFNNLLAAVTGSASLLLDNLDDRTKVKTNAERILAAGGRAGTMVERLLELGTRKSESRRLDLREPFAEAADLLRAGGAARATFSASSPDLPLLANADPTDVLQVLLNLAINARDSVSGRRGQVHLKLAAAVSDDLGAPCHLGRLQPDGAYALFTVSDSGQGMTPDQLAKIFEPYFTTKGAAGTGLGLAVVASILKTTGGAIRVTSDPGEGSCFEVFWPLQPPAAKSEASKTEDADLALDGLTILAVDDVGAVVQVIAGLLESQGAEVATCELPGEALVALEEDPRAWDMLITDYDMPVLSGLELAQKARALRPDLPILLCTALSGRRHLGDNPEELFDAIVQKPVKRRALIAAVKAAMVKRQAKREINADSSRRRS
ncbi:MAG: PAS domain-containing protein [Rhodospirillales bacterium]